MEKDGNYFMIIWFGKFKGTKIRNLPSDYLKWVAENVENEDVCCAADEEYRWRTNNNEHFYDD